MVVLVGDRVSVSNRKATVRYVGEVEGHAGVWAGLEWDNPTGGKHDGTVKGRRYFTTRYPTNGSLMKVSAIPDGVDLLAAINDRYNVESEEVTSGVISACNINRQVELVGMRKIYGKQCNVHHLTRIVLETQCVNRPPPPDSCAPFSYCLELNLYGNLLHKWDHVRDILKLFPQLVELALRGNRMESIEEPIEPLTSSTLLTDLLLSDCDLTGETIYHVLSAMPSISLLYALRNRVTSFCPSPLAASRLVTLDLEANDIRSFDNIVGDYPGLRTLNLSNCHIERVTIANPSRFPALRVLYLKGNNVTDWPSIGELNKLAALSELSIEVAGFSIEKEISVFEVMIAKLTRLTMLNRLVLSEVERRSAEVRFVAKYSNLPEDQRREHQSDIDRLVKMHGAAAADTIKTGMGTVKMSICHGGKTVQKSLPLSSTVQKLNEMLCRLFRIDPLASRLHLLNSEGYEVPLSDDPLRPFSFFSPEPNDVLHVTCSG